MRIAPLIDHRCVSPAMSSGTEIINLRGSAPSLSKTKLMEQVLITPYKARNTALRYKTCCDLCWAFALCLADSNVVMVYQHRTTSRLSNHASPGDSISVCINPSAITSITAGYALISVEV